MTNTSNCVVIVGDFRLSMLEGVLLLVAYSFFPHIVFLFSIKRGFIRLWFILQMQISLYLCWLLCVPVFWPIK